MRRQGWAAPSSAPPPTAPAPHLFWMDLASQPLWPTIWVMFLASHQALLSGNSASLLMGGGAASSIAGRTAPTRTRSILPVASRALGLSTDAGEAGGAQRPRGQRGRRDDKHGLCHPTAWVQALALPLTSKAQPWTRYLSFLNLDSGGTNIRTCHGRPGGYKSPQR